MRFESVSLLVVDLRAVLIRLSPLNDLSAVHEVTGKMQRIVTRAGGPYFTERNGTTPYNTERTTFREIGTTTRALISGGGGEVKVCPHWTKIQCALNSDPTNAHSIDFDRIRTA